MIDIVKFTWRNKHGYWIPSAWVTVTTDTEDVRGHAVIGRPSLTDLKVLSRMTIPEELRLTGQVRSLLSHVVLDDPKADDYTAEQMLEAMLVRTA